MIGLVRDTSKGAMSWPSEELSHLVVEVQDQDGATTPGVGDKDLALCGFALGLKVLRFRFLCQGDEVGIGCDIQLESIRSFLVL